MKRNYLKMKNKIKKFVREISMPIMALIAGFFLLIGAISVYATWDNPGAGITEGEYNSLIRQVNSWTHDNPDSPGHITLGSVATSVNMHNKKIINLADTTNTSNGSEAVTKLYVDNKHNVVQGTNKLENLTIGKNYLISVYGIAKNRGKSTHTLGSVMLSILSSSKGATAISHGLTPSKRIDWPDGNFPQSATFIIEAPARTIYGYVDCNLDDCPKATTMRAIEL